MYNDNGGVQGTARQWPAEEIDPKQVILVQVVVEKGSGKGSVFRLHDGINTLGRDINNRVRLPDPKVSRHHCKIRKVGLSIILSDLGARNGTSVNGRSVSECEIKIGDRIAVGNTILRVVDDDYRAESVLEQPAPFSFFRVISMAFSGGRRDGDPQSDIAESYKFLPKNRKAMWKPPPGTNPPESRSKTIVSTDPD